MNNLFSISKFLLITAVFVLFGIGSVFSNYANTIDDVDIDPLYEAPTVITQYFKPEEKFYIVNFFASWCGPCVEEVDSLNDLKKSTDISIYGIALNDTKENLKYLFKRTKNPYKKIALDFPTSHLKNIFLDRIPRTIIIYNDNVIYDHLGDVGARVITKEILPILQKVQNDILLGYKSRGHR